MLVAKILSVGRRISIRYVKMTKQEKVFFDLFMTNDNVYFLCNKLIINNITKFILSKSHLSFYHNKQIQPPRHLSPINKMINNILLIRYSK